MAEWVRGLEGMSVVGTRVAKLRSAHGDSLREAALRTGVSHTTIARIEKGEVTGSFHSTLRKIAEGYGVKVEFLLNGRDPRQEFEFSIRRLSPSERNKLYFVAPRTRTKMVLDFLSAEYGPEFSLEHLAMQIGLDGSRFAELLANWNSADTSEDVYIKVAESLSRLTGISSHWFHWGALDDETPEAVPADAVSAYVELMKKAARAGIQPDVLDMAIELIMIRNQGSKPLPAGH